MPTIDTPPRRSGRGLLHRLTAGAVLLAALGWPATALPAQADTAPPDPGVPQTVSTDALPTAQINGVVWSQVVIGDIVYVGGSFSSARPAGAAPGSQEVARNNLMAYNVKTGVMTSFAPNVNNEVKSLAASPDGRTLYVAGQFTAIGTNTRYRVAAFNTADGSLTGFAPAVNGTVYGIAAGATGVYFGGNFTSVSSTPRGRVAGVTLSGALTGFNATAEGGNVRQLVVSPDGSRVAVGGNFTTMNGFNGTSGNGGKGGYGLALLNSSSGSSLPMPVNTLIRDGNTNAAILAMTGDADGFYGGGYAYSKAQGNLEGVFRADWDGNLVWVEDCHGDTYSIWAAANEVYVAGHPHYCGNVAGFPQTDPNWTFNRGIAFTKDVRGTISKDPYTYYNFEGNPRPGLLSWFPDINAGAYTGKTQGPWSIAGNADYVVYGGEFTRVNNKAQQGLVRFPRRAIAPNDDGPRLSGADAAPAVKNFASGVRVSWPANYDRDNELLSYQLIRDGNNASPVYTRTVASTFWKRPYLNYVDTGVSAGQTHSYRVKATDPFGNSTTSDPVSITVGGGPALNSVDRAALADGPLYYWPFDETSGSTAADVANGEDGALGSGVSRGVAGSVSGQPGSAYHFSGTSSGTVATQVKRRAPQILSLEAWFRTGSTRGGKLIGFGNAASGNSTAFDRHLYLGNSGRLYFGVYPNAQKVISSSASYNDNQWHHAVATVSPAGMFLYVDGELVKSTLPTDTNVFGAQVNDGYWRIGGDNLGTWQGAGSSAYLEGDLDGVGVYPVALSASQVATHYAARTGQTPNAAPTAAFTSTTSGLTASFNASGSSDSDGTIASYAWDFGDGGTATGATPSHTYTAGGSYPVTLTVTDNDGATDQVSHTVTVTGPVANSAPTAAFTSSVNNLAVSFNGSGSTDSDGTIASYAWDFGDGGTATTVSPSHTYATAGTYPVTLKVTDNDGATDQVTHNVTVTAAPDPGGAFAADAFDRAVSGGWGSADTGGAWSVSTAADFSASSGSGKVVLGKGMTRKAWLGGVQQESTDLTVDLAVDKDSTGGTNMITVEGRRVSATDTYRALLRLNTSKQVSIALEKSIGGAVTSMAAAVTVPGTLNTGDVIHVRMQTFGSGTTTVQAKAWIGNAPEPAWMRVATSADAALQAPGGIGLIGYVSGSATNAPVTLSVLDLQARPVA